MAAAIRLDRDLSSSKQRCATRRTLTSPESSRAFRARLILPKMRNPALPPNQSTLGAQQVPT
jgi:hypothetical protein